MSCIVTGSTRRFNPSSDLAPSSVRSAGSPKTTSSQVWTPATRTITPPVQRVRADPSACRKRNILMRSMPSDSRAVAGNHDSAAPVSTNTDSNARRAPARTGFSISTVTRNVPISSFILPPRPVPSSTMSTRGVSILRTVVCAALVAVPAAAQVTLHLTVPVPTSAPIFVAGSFNQWYPGASEYRLRAQAGGQYAITLPPGVRGAIEFKFTLGSWDAVEQDSAGRDVPNRTFTVPATGTASYAATVARWRDGSARPLPPSSASPQVSVLTDSFAMPQLGRTRRVWLYLPPGYATSQQRYPVLYMHDGQNVFDARTSFAGEWGVDETLDSLHAQGAAGTIIVAVDNGHHRPLSPYSPPPHPHT